MNKEVKSLIDDMKEYIRDPFYILVPERYNVEKLLDYINQLELEVYKLRHYRLIHHTHYGKTSNQVFLMN